MAEPPIATSSVFRAAAGCRSIGGLVALLVLGQPLLAQAPAEDALPKALDKAAARAEDRRTSYAAESAPIDIARSPNQIRIFDAEDIATSGAKTVGEFLLKELPGQILAPGGPGLPARPYLGGSRPQDAVVLLDGLRLGDASAMGVDLNTIPLLGIERIEVIIGPLSSRYGNQAQGGAIALFSTAGRGAASFGELTGAGGNGGAGRSSATPGYAWGSGWIQGGGVSARENQSTATDRPYRQSSVLFGIGHSFGATTVSFGYRNHFQGVPDPYQKTTALERAYEPGRETSFRSETMMAGLHWKAGPGFGLGLDLAGSRITREEPNDLVGSALAFDDRRFQVIGSLHFVLSKVFTATFRVDALEDRIGVPGALIGRSRARDRGLGAGLELALEVHPRLRLSVDFRQQWDTLTIVPGGTSQEVRRTTSQNAWRLAANLALPAGFRLYAAGGVGANVPLLPQLLASGGTALENEKNAFALLGLGWGSGNWFARLESQSSRYDAPIVPTATGFANGADLRFQGAEGTLGWRNAKKFGLEGFLRSQEGRDFGAPEGQQLRTSNVQGRPFATRGLRTWLGGGTYRVDVQYNQIGRRYEAVGTYNCNTLAPQVITTGAVFNDVTIIQTLTVGKHWIFIWRIEHILQPTPDVADWLAKHPDAKNDAYRVYGYPTTGPRTTFEARFKF
jgi:hypothetical protein